MRTAMKLLAGLYALAIYGFIFLPVAILVLYSFQATLFPIPPFTGPSLRWYEAVLSDRRLLAGFANSVTVAVLSSAIAVILGFLAAYGFARFRLPAQTLLRAVVTAPLMVSYLVLGMGRLRKSFKARRKLPAMF
jgi:spermidine/putrescine transport system permease protein